MPTIPLDDLLKMPPFSLPTPETPLARARAFAHEMAFGAVMEYWGTAFEFRHRFAQDLRTTFGPLGSNEQFDLFRQFATRKWNDQFPFPSILVALGLLHENEYAPKLFSFALTERAYALLEEAADLPLFISYRREASSAFALLLYEMMKKAGVRPFLDITGLEPGVEWEQKLHSEIRQRPYMLCLVGKTTLNSEWVQREIMFAANLHKTLIPVYHGGCSVANVESLCETDAAKAVAAVLLGRQVGFTVDREDPAVYAECIRRLLGYFGVGD